MSHEPQNRRSALRLRGCGFACRRLEFFGAYFKLQLQQEISTMSVYVIGTYDIIDPRGYEGYVSGVVPLLEKHGAEILAADFEAQALEGRAPGVNVVLKFPSEEAARNWYNDPAYGPVKNIRLNSSKNGTIVMAKEFKAPPA
jgi:uncharacterized protein (DUF1330 family)